MSKARDAAGGSTEGAEEHLEQGFSLNPALPEPRQPRVSWRSWTQAPGTLDLLGKESLSESSWQIESYGFCNPRRPEIPWRTPFNKGSSAKASGRQLRLHASLRTGNKSSHGVDPCHTCPHLWVAFCILPYSESANWHQDPHVMEMPSHGPKAHCQEVQEQGFEPRAVCAKALASGTLDCRSLTWASSTPQMKLVCPAH